MAFTMATGFIACVSCRKHRANGITSPRVQAPELNGKTGEFTVTQPSPENHGPVHVAHTYHFAYADGSPYKELGTTCYVWELQTEALQEETLKTLATAPFNKIRFCVFPKHYQWNTNEPIMYPFVGEPLTNWDFTRFNPKYFQHLEQRIAGFAETWHRGGHHSVSSV